jgi:Fic family protein
MELQKHQKYIAKRQTASEYLKKLEANDILGSIKIGNEIYYINKELIQVLSK